jgi:hypothetical protein
MFKYIASSLPDNFVHPQWLREKSMQCLLHVSDNDRWLPALRNAGNFLKAVSEEGGQVVVLANGPAVSGFMNPEILALMTDLSARSVRFQACRNALVLLAENPATAIDEAALPGFVEVVPAGIVALVQWQDQGFAYVKP